MRVYGKDGEVVAESPVRDPEAVAQEALREAPSPSGDAQPSHLLADATNLAPIDYGLEAVRRYSATGSLAKVSRELCIAIYELQKLQRAACCQTELAALRREDAAIRNARLTRIHDLTLDQLEDRLEHGDLVQRGRSFVRQKVSGRDLARISEAVFKQRQLLLGEPTEIHENKKLEKLADQLRALGKRDPVAAQALIDRGVIDVTAREVEATTPAPMGRDTTREPAAHATAEREHARETIEGDA